MAASNQNPVPLGTDSSSPSAMLASDTNLVQSISDNAVSNNNNTQQTQLDNQVQAITPPVVDPVAVQPISSGIGSAGGATQSMAGGSTNVQFADQVSGDNTATQIKPSTNTTQTVLTNDDPLQQQAVVSTKLEDAGSSLTGAPTPISIPPINEDTISEVGTSSDIGAPIQPDKLIQTGINQKVDQLDALISDNQPTTVLNQSSSAQDIQGIENTTLASTIQSVVGEDEDKSVGSGEEEVITPKLAEGVAPISPKSSDVSSVGGLSDTTPVATSPTQADTQSVEGVGLVDPSPAGISDGPVSTPVSTQPVISEPEKQPEVASTGVTAPTPISSVAPLNTPIKNDPQVVMPVQPEISADVQEPSSPIVLETPIAVQEQVPAKPVEPIVPVMTAQTPPGGNTQAVQNKVGVTQLQSSQGASPAPGTQQTSSPIQPVPVVQKHNSGQTLDQLIATKQAETSQAASMQLPSAQQNSPAVQPLIEEPSRVKKSKNGSSLIKIVVFIVVGVGLLLLGLYLSPNLSL